MARNKISTAERVATATATRDATSRNNATAADMNRRGFMALRVGADDPVAVTALTLQTTGGAQLVMHWDSQRNMLSIRTAQVGDGIGRALQVMPEACNSIFIKGL